MTGTDSSNGTATSTVTMTGTAPVTASGTNPGAIDFSMLSDVTPSFSVSYARTSFNHGTNVLYADFTATDIGKYSVRTPFLVGVRHISAPSVRVRSNTGVMPDGTPFWFGATGSSRSTLSAWAAQLATTLPPPRWRDVVSDEDGGCVDVDFFARYPLRDVWQEHEPVRAKAGELKGRYRLEFANGNWITITSRGELTLHDDNTIAEKTIAAGT